MNCMVFNILRGQWIAEMFLNCWGN